MQNVLIAKLVVSTFAMLMWALAASPTVAQQNDSANMGQLQRDIQTQMDLGNPDGAIESGMELLALTGQAYGKRSADYAFLAYQIARIAMVARNFDLARRMYDEALTVGHLTLGKELRQEILSEAARFKGMFGDPTEMAELLEEALALLESNPIPDSYERAVLIGNLAAAYSAAGRNSDAIDYGRRSMELFAATIGRDAEETLRAQHNNGVNLGRQGLADQAIETLLDVHQRRSATMGPNHRDTINSLNSLATMYFGNGDIEEAEQILEQVIAVREVILEPDHPDTLASFEFLARIAYADYDAVKAIAIYDRIIAANRKLFSDATHDEILRPVSLRAQIYHDIGRVAEAEQEWRQSLAALDVADKGDTVSAQALAFNLGKSLHERGDTEGLRLLERSYTASQAFKGQGFEGTLLAGVEYASGLLDTGQNVERALAPASNALDFMLARRDALYAGTESSQALADETKNIQIVGQVFADALWANSGGEIDANQRGRLLKALQLNLETPASEATKRAVLRVAASREDLGLQAQIDQREQLTRQRTANQEQLRGALAQVTPVPSQLETLNSERLSIASAISAIDNQLRVQFPDYFSILSPALAQIDEVSAILRADEAVIVLVPTDLGTHVVAVTNQGSQWNRSRLDGDAITQQVRQLMYFVSDQINATHQEEEGWKAAVDGGLNGFDRDTAHQLYRELFGPLEEFLEGKNQWLLAPSGELASLPFSILVTEVPEGQDDDPNDLRKTAWLIDSAALSQLPSLQTLLFTRQLASTEQARGNGQLIGFGNPVLAEFAATPGSRGVFRNSASVELRALPDGEALADPEQLRGLASLPGTALELNGMAEILGRSQVELYLADNATEAAVKQADLSQAGTLVFATHGLLANEILGLAEPGLVFTPPAEATEWDDGYLSASEVIELRLGADWVILSACNTAAPSGDGATALSGLARAFFFAGAQSLLVSHWLVRDDVAPTITVSLVSRNTDQDGALSPAEVLRDAMIAVRNNTSKDEVRHEGLSSSFAHPSAWAPFILVGGL